MTEKWPSRVREIISEYRGRCNVVGEYLALKELAIAFAKAEEAAKPVEAKAEAGENESFKAALKEYCDKHYYKPDSDFLQGFSAGWIASRPAPAANTEGLREKVETLTSISSHIVDRWNETLLQDYIMGSLIAELDFCREQVDAALRGEVDHTIMSKYIDHKDNLD